MDYSVTFLAIFLGIIFVIALVIVLPFYIIGSIGLMKIAQNKGIDDAWLAWIPFVNLYILGKIVDNFDLGSANINKLELVLPLVAIASGIFASIPLIGGIFALATYVLYIFTFIKLYKMYVPSQYTLYTVLSCLGLFSIMFFLIRNNTPEEVPSIGKPIFN